jgi:ubiquinone/menaquinone biosynthesis methyltransferase
VKLTAAFSSPDNKRQYVRTLFATIADRYDFITVVLSFGRDRHWKQRLVHSAGLRPGARVLDLASGTGDIAFACAQAGARAVGLDITPRMIELAAAKARLATDDRLHRTRFLVGDMMALPFRTACVDVVTTGYGLRNVPVLADAVAEIARVLKPGGQMLSLDFNRPTSAVVRRAYLAYLTIVGSTLGWLLHRDPDTYRYIPESLRRYPSAHGVARLLQEHGFERVSIVPVFAGFMTLHVATRRA